MTRTTPTPQGSVPKAAAQKVTDYGAQVQRHAGDWLEHFARLGYAAKGVLYLLIGILAFQAAIGWGGQVGDSRSALSTLEGQWAFGRFLLWPIGIGLVAYSLWNLFRAILDPEREGSDAKGLLKRFFFLISAGIHASLAFAVFRHLLSDSGVGGDGGGGTRDAVGRALEWGFAGRVVIAVIGGCIVGFGVQQIIKAWKIDLSDQLELSRMTEGTRRITVYTGRFGLGARGIVFVIVGWFFLQAAWYAASGEAGGLGDALRTVGSFGWLLLGAIALGLTAYGIHMFITARHRRIDIA